MPGDTRGWAQEKKVPHRTSIIFDEAELASTSTEEPTEEPTLEPTQASNTEMLQRILVILEGAFPTRGAPQVRIGTSPQQTPPIHSLGHTYQKFLFQSRFKTPKLAWAKANRNASPACQ
jgi:hypothetical protein